MGILVCVATGAEARACAGGIKNADFINHFETLKTGVGLKKAEASLEKRLQSKDKPSLIISSGFAGSLTNALSVGSWICAKEIWNSKINSVIPMNDAWVSRLETPGVISCGVLSVSELHQFPQNNKLQNPIAVDMESEALAIVAAKHGINFQVLRMITDTPTAPLSSLAIDWAKVLSADRWVDQMIGGYQLVKNFVLHPKNMACFVRNSFQWLSLLHLGWKIHAKTILSGSSV